MDKLKRCLNCNNFFERPYRSISPKWGKWKITWNNYKKRKFCSGKCRGEWQSKNMIADKSSNWRGGSFCIDCDKRLSSRYHYPKRCRKCWNKFICGENHWNWKGGISEKRSIANPKYKTWRKSVFERDNYTCQICGYKRGKILNAHHVKSWKKFPKLRFMVSNGLTLCKKCHYKTLISNPCV